MGFRGQEGAYSAKWETLRDDVHEAELGAYEIEKSVAVLERKVHEREHPVDARVFRGVAFGVVLLSVLLAPRLAAMRPGVDFTLEARLTAAMLAVCWAGPAVLHALLGRTRNAWLSLGVRAVVLWADFHFGLVPQSVLRELSTFDLLAIAGVLETWLLLPAAATIRRPSEPKVPAVPVAPVGLDEEGWRRAVEAMEERVTFAHARRATATERAPKLRAHLESLGGSVVTPRAAFARFGPSYLVLALLFLHQVFVPYLFEPWGPGLLVGVFFLVVTPVSLRAWSEAGRPFSGGFVFFVLRAWAFSSDAWGHDTFVLWGWLLAICAVEPALVNDRIRRRRF
ncbi:MAG: hypothetical protein R3B99_19435 [Polyangiales bacterium]|nr:hypothetical protein [Myxococcales bacterium]MCB9601530.1 hypothetical protein [Sandaracinus sp.]